MRIVARSLQCVGTLLLLTAPVAAQSTREKPADSDPRGAVTGVIFRCDFDGHPAGVYQLEDFRADWNRPRWQSGFEEGRVSLVEDDSPAGGRSLRVHYPEGGVGPAEGGAQWRLTFERSYDELYCAFRVRFGEGFEFVKGGKIPGLVGGKANTGGRPPDGTDGWSARMMWSRADAWCSTCTIPTSAAGTGIRCGTTSGVSDTLIRVSGTGLSIASS